MMSTEQRVFDAITRVVGGDTEITKESSIEAVDSLEMLEIILELEEAFDTIIPLDTEFETVKDIVTFFEREVK